MKKLFVLLIASTLFLSNSAAQSLYNLFSTNLLMSTADDVQQTVAATGGEASGTGGNVSFTAGQVDFISIRGPNGIIELGIQHAYDVETINSIDDKYGIDLNIKVFPNPVSEKLILNFQSDIDNSTSYELYNLDGKLLKSEAVTNKETEITMTGKGAGTYFLKVMVNGKLVKVFKIVKY